MEILCFGSADYEEPNWVNAQHLMSRLAEHHRVLYVNSLGLRVPRANRRDLRKVWRRLAAPVRGLRRPDPARELFVYSPLTLPPLRLPLARHAGSALLAGGLRRALTRLGFTRPLTWAFLPSAAPVLRRLALGPVVYHCVDAYEANPGVDPDLVRMLEDDILAQAAAVVAVSPPLVERLSRRHPRVVWMPNVAAIEAYPPPSDKPSEPPQLADLPRPRLGYLGNLAGYKCDLPLLARAARRRPDWQWVFIGAVGQGEADTPLGELRRLANVVMLGPQPRERLAAFVHHLDVGLIPARPGASTRHAFPMKFFEYWACGRPVVSARLPALQDHLVPPLAFGYDDGESFLAAIGEALASDAPAHAAERRRRAETHSWERRIPEVEALLETLVREAHQRSATSVYSP
ncbi:MAG: glycosyltransferase [Candidatus Eisenbacteria sp.]|nr:glycosyltransferase [Candidatus Eisenbacteria bacterium]